MSRDACHGGVEMCGRQSLLVVTKMVVMVEDEVGERVSVPD